MNATKFEVMGLADPTGRYLVGDIRQDAGVWRIILLKNEEQPVETGQVVLLTDEQVEILRFARDQKRAVEEAQHAHRVVAANADPVFQHNQRAIAAGIGDGSGFSDVDCQGNKD